MNNKLTMVLMLVFGYSVTCNSQEDAKTRPSELEVLKAAVGVWDAHVEVWPQGPAAKSMKFSGVETNRPYGEYWISSDLDTNFDGQTMKVHSIVGYDLDQKKLVGMIIDHGPYSAQMTGEYDQKTKTIHWKTEAKDLSGKKMVQHTTLTQTSPDKRILVLSVPGKEDGKPTKFMEITFVKRKQPSS